MDSTQQLETGTGTILSPVSYMTGSAQLRAVGELVSLHPKIKVRYIGNTKESEVPVTDMNDGQMKSVFNREEKMWDMSIDYKTDPTQFLLQDVFVRGHEEGHFLHYSGNLKHLYRWCKQAGIPALGEMPWKKVLHSDRIAKSFYNGNSENIADFFWAWRDSSMISPNTVEQIANLGGLLALHKAGFTKEMKALEKLAREDYLGHFPDFLRRFESTRAL